MEDGEPGTQAFPVVAALALNQNLGQLLRFIDSFHTDTSSQARGHCATYETDCWPIISVKLGIEQIQTN